MSHGGGGKEDEHADRLENAVDRTGADGIEGKQAQATQFERVEAAKEVRDRGEVHAAVGGDVRGPQIEDLIKLGPPDQRKSQGGQREDEGRQRRVYDDWTR